MFFEFLDTAVSETHPLDFSVTHNNKHPFPLVLFSCFCHLSQTIATISLVLLSALSFLPPRSWVQHSSVPKGREIRLSIYSKLVASRAILITPGP